MKRRNFLKFAFAAPIILKYGCKNGGSKVIFQPETEKTFPYLEVKGEYKEIGFQIGTHFRKNIETIIKRRRKWFDNLKGIHDSKNGKIYSKKLLESVKTHFPHLIKELEGIAEGAGLDFRTIWMLSIKSELDALNRVIPEQPGCSTIYYKDTENNWLFHNEDGHNAFRDQMFVLKATPPSGVSFITFVYPGIIPGVGPSMNSNGIIETTNFIGCLQPDVGIPRYFLGRAILESKNLKEAQQIAEFHSRAFPWHHNLASVKTGVYISVETLPDGTVQEAKPEGIYLHTNHTIGKNTCDYMYQDDAYKNSSSISRYNVLADKISEATLPIKSKDTILNWLSSHKNAPYSPCRHPEGKILGRTLGTAFFDIKKGVFRLYKGNPCEATRSGFFSEYKI